MSIGRLLLYTLLVIIYAGYLSACQPNNALLPGTSSTNTETLGETPTNILPTEASDSAVPTRPAATLTFTPTPSGPPLPLTNYTLSATLDYDLHTVAVKETIDYVNHTHTDLSDLILLVEPNRYLGGFSLESLTGEDDQPIDDYSLNGAVMAIPLKQPLIPGESTRLSLTYNMLLPNQTAPFGYTSQQTNLGDWYPYIPPYVPGEGWLVREDAFYGEHLAYDMASFEVEIRLARPRSAGGQPLIIAASSLPLSEGEVYRYKHAPARNFVWTVSDQYLVQETEVEGIRVMSYAFPFHPQAERPALEETAKALALFNQLYSPYPHQALSVVEADFLDGMEFDGLIFLSHAFYDYYTGDQKSNLTIIAAHEVAHQWFYGLVGNDQALEPWLDEALCTMSELYFYENVYPDLAQWWWENRIAFHDPQGWVDSTIYDAAGFYPYRNAVYLRGAMFLIELREMMGEEPFLAFIRDYVNKYSYRQATGNDFFALLASHTRLDLTNLIGNYFAKRH